MSETEKNKSNEKKLEDIADVIAGQILTRVISKNNDGETVPVLSPKAIVSGVVIRDDLGSAILSKKLAQDKYTQKGDVVIKLSTPYDAAFVTEADAGLLVPSFCATIRIKEDSEVDARYLTAFLNSSYVKDQLTAKVVGSGRPMIKITDIRALGVPGVSAGDMKDIGEAYILSGKKKAVLNEMIAAEDKLMENIVLASIKEVGDNG